MKLKVVEFKEKTNRFTVVFENLDTIFLVFSRAYCQLLRHQLTCPSCHAWLFLTQTSRRLIIPNAHTTVTTENHMLSHKGNVNKIKWMKTVNSVPPEHKKMKKMIKQLEKCLII